MYRKLETGYQSLLVRWRF